MIGDGMRDSGGMATGAQTSQLPVCELAGVFATPQGRCARVSVLGVTATVVYSLLEEDERRRAVGLGAITSPDVLRPLLGLPAGERIRLTALTLAERRELACVPAGAVEVADGFVVRRAVAPLRVELAVVTARRWRTGLKQAGRFAPFCTRAVLLPAFPRDRDLVRLEAGYYGIGVIVAEPGGEAQVLVPPAVFRRRRLTVAGMRFPEEVYRQVR